MVCAHPKFCCLSVVACVPVRFCFLEKGILQKFWKILWLPDIKVLPGCRAFSHSVSTKSIARGLPKRMLKLRFDRYLMFHKINGFNLFYLNRFAAFQCGLAISVWDCQFTGSLTTTRNNGSRIQRKWIGNWKYTSFLSLCPFLGGSVTELLARRTRNPAVKDLSPVLRFLRTTSWICYSLGLSSNSRPRLSVSKWPTGCLLSVGHFNFVMLLIIWVVCL